jgi:cell division initiation protein
MLMEIDPEVLGKADILKENEGGNAMVLTPMEIHNKEFSRGFRGYSEEEVDEFLDEIVVDYERLYKENLDLKDRIAMLSDEVRHYKAIEGTLKETLLTAQKAADDVADNARKKAELIIQDAENQARAIIANANKEVVDIHKEIEDKKKQLQIFKTQFRSFLETQLELIKNETFLEQNNDGEE